MPATSVSDKSHDKSHQSYHTAHCKQCPLFHARSHGRKNSGIKCNDASISTLEYYDSKFLNNSVFLQ